MAENKRTNKRTQEEIDEILSLAKISKDDLLPGTQTIYFADDLSAQQNYKFLELNKKIQETLKIGDVLHIIGEPNDNAVLCTKDTTYNVVESETSNSLLLAKDLKLHNNQSVSTTNTISEVVVHGTFFKYLELIQQKPKFDKLYTILEKTMYKGPEYEYSFDANDTFTFDVLWHKVQASEEELKCALKIMKAITINGKVRLLDLEYHFRVLSFMLKIVEENSWQLDEVDYDVTEEALTDLVPLDILKSLFDLYSEETKVRDGVQLYRYNERDVCTLLAEVLLSSAGKFNLDDFLQAWQESVPEGMQTSESMLYGISIIDKKSTPNSVRSFPERQLPQNINERFKMLFDAKAKWSVDEIAPYIQSLTNDKQDVNTLLTKYARSSKVDGIKYYSSKHGK